MQAKDRFKDIRPYRVIQERGFDFPKPIANPHFFQVITRRGWESLIAMIFEHANKTLALEFYANARFMGKKYLSYVRGKEIDYNLERINNLLQIIPLEECDVQRRLAECKDWNDAQWDALKAQLCVDGAKWQGGSHMLLRADFKTVAKA